MQCLSGHIANRNRQCIVSHPAIIINPNVNFDDVPVLNNTRATNAVNDFFIDGNADVAGKLPVA